MRANVSESPVSALFRRLRATRPLKGVLLLAGQRAKKRETGPGRILLYPAEGSPTDPSDSSISILDVKQGVGVEVYAKGSSSGREEEQALRDWDAAWDLLVRFIQALAEQGENPSGPTDPGLFWQITSGPHWPEDEDSSPDGAVIALVVSAVCVVPAASDDTGHVGDNWTDGPAEAVSITGAP